MLPFCCQSLSKFVCNPHKYRFYMIVCIHSHTPLSTFSHFLLSSKSELYLLTKPLFHHKNKAPNLLCRFRTLVVLWLFIFAKKMNNEVCEQTNMNYSNSILYTFKSIQHIHYMVIYTITSCIILYSKSFTYILYSFWSHCEYILSTSILISSTITIKEWEWITLTR